MPPRSKKSQPHTGVPSLEHQSWEEEPIQQLAVKTAEDSTHLGEKEGYWKPRCTLKGTAHKISLSGTHRCLWQRDGGSEGARVTQGEIEVCGFEERAGRTAADVPVLSPLLPPTDASFLGGALTHMAFPGELQPHPDSSQRPCPTQLTRSCKLCQWKPAWVQTAVFLFINS